MTENSRRIERERILSLLYEAEMKEAPVGDVLAELPVAPEDFVVETVTGVGGVGTELDAVIDRHAIGWASDRMAAIDRCVLRLGVWELQNRPDLSIALIISEAVELAKRFSTEESGKFVNGVLAAVANEIRGS